MNKQDAREIAMIAAVMGREIYDDVYNVYGTVDSYRWIAEKSIEFYKRFGDVDWERAKDDLEFCKMIGLPDGIHGDWDEIILEWGRYHLRRS